MVSRVVPLDGRDDTEVLALAAALERRSEHPLAHAILTAAVGPSEDADGLPPVSDFRSVSGRGAEGVVLGNRYLIGSPRFFAERGADLDEANAALAEV